jgi:hypothetical protein
MSVERVRINPNIMRLKNASGTTIFDTTNRYIKTTSPGSINLAALAPAPFPNGITSLSDGAGFLIFNKHLNALTVDAEETLPTVSNVGFLGFRQTMFAAVGGGGPQAGTLRQGTLIQVFKNGVHLFNIDHFAGPLYGGGVGGPSGFIHIYVPKDLNGNNLNENFVQYNISVSPTDVVKFRYKWRVTLDNNTYANQGRLYNYTVFYYSGSDTLPLVVTN